MHIGGRIKKIYTWQIFSRIWKTEKRSMGPVLIWPTSTLDVNIFKKMLAMGRLSHTVSSKSPCAEKMQSLVTYRCKWFCDISVMFRKWNSHANSIHRSHMTTNNTFLSYWHLYHPIRELFTSTYIETCSYYIQKCIFQDHYMKGIISLPSRLSYVTYNFFFLLRPISSATKRALG